MVLPLLTRYVHVSHAGLAVAERSLEKFQDSTFLRDWSQSNHLDAHHYDPDASCRDMYWIELYVLHMTCMYAMQQNACYALRHKCSLLADLSFTQYAVCYSGDIMGAYAL